MLDGYTNTGKTVKFDNGKEFSVFSKETKTGVRYYRWSLGRFFPVSKNDIN